MGKITLYRTQSKGAVARTWRAARQRIRHRAARHAEPTPSGQRQYRGEPGGCTRCADGRPPRPRGRER